MSRGRLISVLSGVVLASGVAVAQPKAPAPAPAAPAAGAPAPADGSGSAVQPIEEAPPADMEGTSEDPDAPRGGDEGSAAPTGPATPAPKSSGYPVAEAERPIILPQGMTEASIAPHFTADPFNSSDALRIRFGLTPRVQLGLTYAFGGVFDDPTTTKKDYKFGVGKTAGLDVTVLVKNWLGVRVGLPVYFDPFAMSLNLGAPVRFRFGKLTVGGLDEVMNVKLSKFAPQYEFEGANQAIAAALDIDPNTQIPNGYLRFAGYGIYQTKPNLALIGRFGIVTPLNSSSSGSAGTGAISETTTFLRVGVQVTPKKFLDLGINAGFDDLSRVGSFGLGGFLAVRI